MDGHKMRTAIFVLAVLLCIDSAYGADDGHLTVAQAKKLLPEAAGMRNADLKSLSEAAEPNPDLIKSKSLTLVLFSFRPQPDAKNAEAIEKEFRFLGNGVVNPAKIATTISTSAKHGYASFIQEEWITDCTCKSTTDKAEGTVKFKTDVFEGQIQFKAEKWKDGWTITEFHMPAIKTKIARGKDGNWKRVELKPS
jgi:hypothetical protein